MPERTGGEHDDRPPRGRKRDANGRFVSGSSGNPKGRPKGSRNRATLAAQGLLDGEASKLARKAVELALAGDTAALRLCLERVLPPCKDSPIAIALPAMRSTRDAVTASAALVEAVATGQLSPTQGATVSRLLEAHRKAIEIEELEGRLAEVEEGLRQEEAKR